jgi:hypothetical protein
MAKRHLNYRHVKIHRSYTVADIVIQFGIHKNTVRNWLKNGLTAIDNSRPLLIHGEVLSAYLKAKRTKNKQKCKPGEIYCVRCRAPKVPAGDMADCKPVTEKIWNLVAICPDCDKIINQRVGLARLVLIRTKIDITMPQALQHLVDSYQPSVSSDLKRSRKP